jgi:hypothetical protein
MVDGPIAPLRFTHGGTSRALAGPASVRRPGPDSSDGGKPMRYRNRTSASFAVHQITPTDARGVPLPGATRSGWTSRVGPVWGSAHHASFALCRRTPGCPARTVVTAACSGFKVSDMPVAKVLLAAALGAQHAIELMHRLRVLEASQSQCTPSDTQCGANGGFVRTVSGDVAYDGVDRARPHDDLQGRNWPGRRILHR